MPRMNCVIGETAACHRFCGYRTVCSVTLEARVRRWVETAVIGLDLCPFASAVHRAGRLQIRISHATSAEEAVRAGLDAATELLDTPASETSTTLVVLADCLDDFEPFLDAAATLEALLSEAGADGWLQVATFHPRYRFEDSDADDVANYTNRAPRPMFHLLRESEVTAAVDAHPDAEGIPGRNTARLQAMGVDAVRALWRRFDE